jgi:hypothetical protein
MAGWDEWMGGTWCTRDKAGKILEGLNGSITNKVRFTGASCTDSHFYSTPCAGGRKQEWCPGGAGQGRTGQATGDNGY